MSSQIYNALLREKTDIFKAAFSTLATEVFFDPESRRIRHTGEYGLYREAVVRDFLKFVVPRSLDVSTGFLITSMNDVSTQCDAVIFDSRITPLYQEGDRQRFFPVESVFGVVEVKSTVSRPHLSIALNKLAAVKALGERIVSPTIVRRTIPGHFNPAEVPYDLIPSILICQKLDFNLNSIENELDDLYDPNVLHRHKHNIILSIEDGLLSYQNQDTTSYPRLTELMVLPFPQYAETALKHKFTFPANNPYIHLDLFASCLFMLTANKTLLYPETSEYLGPIEGGRNRVQT